MTAKLAVEMVEQKKLSLFSKPKDLFIRATTLRTIDCLQRNRYMKTTAEIIKSAQISHTILLPILKMFQKTGLITAEHADYPNPFIVSDKIAEATPQAFLSLLNNEIDDLSKTVQPELFNIMAAEYGLPGDWRILEFLRITIHPGKETMYEFSFENTSFSLAATDFDEPKKFTTAFLNSFGMLLSPLKKRTWVQLFNYLLQNAEVSSHYEEISESQFVIDAVLDYVENCACVDKIEHAIGDGYCYQSGDSLLVPNDVLRRVLAREGYSKVPPRQILSYLKPFLTQNSDSRKVGQRSQRFWFFKTDQFAEKEIISFDNPIKSEVVMNG